MKQSPLIIDLEGPDVSTEEVDLLSHPLVGGVILFSKNIESPAQICALTQAIQAINPNLFICVDQEGGRVQRLKTGFTKLPALYQFGEIYEQDPAHARMLAEICGWLMAVETLSVGIDFSFAPVLDLGLGTSEVIFSRAFHADPVITAELALVFTHGMYQAGMIAVGKHFPGHGGVAADSHHTLPVDTRPIKALEAEIYPFKHLIQHDLPAIMPGHILFSGVDETVVTYSTHWLKTILREQLGFKGIIISDDLAMAAAKIDTFPRCAQMALEAGCDMVLICHHREAVLEVLADPPRYTPRPDFSTQHLKGRPFLPYDALLQNPNWARARQQITALTQE